MCAVLRSAPPGRPALADHASQFVLLERAVEDEYRPRMLDALQEKVNAVAESVQVAAPLCARCGQPMRRQRHAAGLLGGAFWMLASARVTVSLSGL